MLNYDDVPPTTAAVASSSIAATSSSAAGVPVVSGAATTAGGRTVSRLEALRQKRRSKESQLRDRFVDATSARLTDNTTESVVASSLVSMATTTAAGSSLGNGAMGIDPSASLSDRREALKERRRRIEMLKARRRSKEVELRRRFGTFCVQRTDSDDNADRRFL